MGEASAFPNFFLRKRLTNILIAIGPLGAGTVALWIAGKYMED